MLRTSRTLFGCVLALAWIVPVRATTLQQLSLNDIIQKSTAIVRGTVQQSVSSLRGTVVYTHYTVRVSEVWKGNYNAQVDVGVPGGVVNGFRETYSGAPELQNGQEYVLFLWTSKTGLTQVIGLSQGLFTLQTNSAGQTLATRLASSARMLSPTGQAINDGNLQMPLTDLRTRVQSVLGGHLSK